MSLKKQFSNSTCKVTFTLPKNAVSGAKNVKVLGDFNAWNPSNAVMMKAAKEQFEAVVELPVGKDYQFRYLINDSVWENDWNADNYVKSPYDGIDNSVVFVRENMGSRKVVNNSTVTATEATPAKKVVKATTAKATKTATAAKTASVVKVQKDDLKKIEGIGAAIEKIFNEAGITTFSILSKTSTSSLKAILDAAGTKFKMHNPTTWPVQAKMAANGEWTKLAVWQKELNGGK